MRRVNGGQVKNRRDTAVNVRFVAGETYEFRARGHRILVDQPPEIGGDDTAPTPVELFVASLATCVAFYAGRYLVRHGFSRDDLRVWVDYTMSSERPARVEVIHLAVRVPESLPVAQRSALRAVLSHCTIYNSLSAPPAITIDLS